MKTIKQKTIDGNTLKLQRRKTDKRGKRYEYHLKQEPYGKVAHTVYTKERVMELFRKTRDEMQPSDGLFSGGGLF